MVLIDAGVDTLLMFKYPLTQQRHILGGWIYTVYILVLLKRSTIHVAHYQMNTTYSMHAQHSAGKSLYISTHIRVSNTKVLCPSM